MINGSPKGFFPDERGLRQGDPLSPFLFVIVAATLGRMVNKAATEGLLGGYKAADAIPLVSHLQYADDTLIFCEADEDQIRNVKAILLCFEVVLGSKINYLKSELIGIKVGEAHLYQYADTLGC